MPFQQQLMKILLFLKNFFHILCGHAKKYSSGLKSSSKSETVYGFKADTVTVNNVTYFNDSDFTKFTNNWIQNASLSKSTKHGYKNIITNYLILAFGSMSLKDIKLSHIQSFQNKLVDKCSNKYINNIIGCL